jgi:hypothetical protein
MTDPQAQHAMSKCPFLRVPGSAASLWRAMLVAIAGGALSLSPIACAKPCAPASHAEMHILTWRDYEGWTNRLGAIYVFDGIEVGKGKPGWENVLKRLQQLRPGETVFIYPFYRSGIKSIVTADGKVIFLDEPNGPQRSMPFSNDVDELHRLVESRGLVIIYSMTEPGAKASGIKAIKFRLLGPNSKPDMQPFMGERPNHLSSHR